MELFGQKQHLNVGRNANMGSSSYTAALGFGGNPIPTAGGATEEWSSSSNTVKVLTD